MRLAALSQLTKTEWATIIGCPTLSHTTIEGTTMWLTPANSGVIIRPIPTPGNIDGSGHVSGYVIAAGGGVPSRWVGTGDMVTYPRENATAFQTEVYKDVPYVPEPMTLNASAPGEPSSIVEIVHLLDQRYIQAVHQPRPGKLAADSEDVWVARNNS